LKALDTNVLARFFVDDGDDEEAARQRPAAVAAMGERGFVSATVLLEFEWVLRGFYEFPRTEILRILTALLGLEHITIEDRALVVAALDAHAQGLDFADALHLARSSRATAFVTFDRRLAKAARRSGLTPKVELLT
jgi:predicted nucleic-acid-binding protein